MSDYGMLAIILGVPAFAWLVTSAGWGTATAVFLLLWANNCSQRSMRR